VVYPDALYGVVAPRVMDFRCGRTAIRPAVLVALNSDHDFVILILYHPSGFGC